MIKMRVNKDKNVICEECGTKYFDTLEMYDIKLVTEVSTVCYDCAGTLFQKLLKANCMYNGRIKDKEDQKRHDRYYTIKNKGIITEHKSINPPVEEDED